MKTALRVLFVLAMAGLVAGPAQAHSIGIRDGGGSTDVCFGGTPWVPLLPSEEFGEEFGEAAYLNNCGVVITSIDFQLSPDQSEISHPPLGVEPFVPGDGDPPNFFDSVQLITGTEFGDVYRFFSSEGNSIDCGESCFIVELLQISQVISANFLFYVLPDEGPLGYVRIVDINQDPEQVVPEPATLFLLSAGLGGLAIGRRRRR